MKIAAITLFLILTTANHLFAVTGCTITTSSPVTVTLDPALATNSSTPSAGNSFVCGTQNNYTYALVTNNGLYWTGTTMRMISGANFLPYTLTLSGLPVAPLTRNVSYPFTVTVTVNGVDYQDAPVGSYSDTVNVTVTDLKNALSATGTITINAAVTGKCGFNAGGSISFGNLDPIAGGTVNAVVTQPAFWCTKNQAYTISDDVGLNEAAAGVPPARMKSPSKNDFVPYSYSYTNAGTGNGKTGVINMNLSASTTKANYQYSTVANDYADTITISILP